MKQQSKILPIAELKDKLLYNQQTGLFYYKIGPKAGAIAGFYHKTSGYIVIKHKGIAYQAHRIAYALTYGDTAEKIDHIDNNRTNNCIANLRLASAVQNAHNATIRVDNTSGVKGLSVKRDGNNMYWYCNINVASIRFTRTFPFTDKGKQLAISWLETKRNDLHKEFANG